MTSRGAGHVVSSTNGTLLSLRRLEKRCVWSPNLKYSFFIRTTRKQQLQHRLSLLLPSLTTRSTFPETTDGL